MKIEVEGMDGLMFVDATEESEWTAKIKSYSREKIAEELGVQVRALNNFVRKEKKKCQSKNTRK